MKLHILYAVLALATFLLGCAGKVPLPKQIPDALNAACGLYTTAKPEVLKAREYAKLHWNDKVPGSDRDLISAEVKKTLLDFDALLPKLDAAGLAICSAAEGINAFQTIGAQGGKVDWNEVLTVVLKGASIALDMKQKGMI
jgi:hypothetical protein